MMVTLYRWADRHEGVVKTRSWGSCTSERCAHASHSPYFEYWVTEIEGDVLWSGEEGEALVRSTGTGRCFYTRYRPRGHHSPKMETRELEVRGGEPVVDGELWETLVRRYGSPRHEVLARLAAVARTP